MGEAAEPPSRPGRRRLVVRAGRGRFALELAAVRRVVRELSVFPIPGSAPGLLGLAEVGGEPLPVLDLARLLGDEARAVGTAPRDAVVVAVPNQGGVEVVGLAVDEALGLEAAAKEGGTAGEDADGPVVVDLARLTSSGDERDRQ